MSEELKRCPFCGGEAEYSTLEDEWGVVSHFVTCPNNCIEGLWSRDVSKEKAIKAWNNRPSPWHTGTPTEDGEYLVLWLDKDEEEKRYSMLFWHSYLNCWYDEETPNALWGDEYKAEVIAWQKIEPYKGN